MLLGVINEDRLREMLTTMGDRFTDDEVVTTMCLKKTGPLRLI